MPNNRCTECQESPCTCPETWVGSPTPPYSPLFPDNEPRVMVRTTEYQRLHDEVRCLRSSLGFYADRSNYRSGRVDVDDGQIARSALHDTAPATVIDEGSKT